MAENDLLKRLFDAGITFTSLTRARAEEVVRDLVRVGEVQAEQAQTAAEELVERSRRNGEQLIESLIGELRHYAENLGLLSRHEEEAPPGPPGKAAAPRAREAAPAKAAPARKAAKAEKAGKPAKPAKAAKAPSRAKKAGGRAASAKKATKKGPGRAKKAGGRSTAKQTSAAGTRKGAAKKAAGGTRKAGGRGGAGS